VTIPAPGALAPDPGPNAFALQQRGNTLAPFRMGGRRRS